MSHFAQVKHNIVVNVIVAEQDFINTLSDKEDWIQTSYNTYGGVHRLGGTPLRKNFAGKDFTYNSVRDAFIPPKMFNSWILDEESCLWKAPIDYPSDGKSYVWDEETVNWLEVNNERFS